MAVNCGERFAKNMDISGVLQEVLLSRGQGNLHINGST